MPIPRSTTDAAALLGLTEHATAEQVNERYRRLALVYHPDRNPDDAVATQRMLELNAARELLLGTRAAELDPAPAPAQAVRRTRRMTPAERARDERVEKALHTLPYAIYVVGTTSPKGVANAMVADWVMQVAFEPRLLAVSFEGDASSLRNVRAARRFTVNLLPQSGMDLAAHFLQPHDPSKVKGRAHRPGERFDKLAGVDHRLSAAGCPILADAVSWLSCEAEQFIPVGEHTLVIGRVTDGKVERTDEWVLTSQYTGWTYGG